MVAKMLLQYFWVLFNMNLENFIYYQGLASFFHKGQDSKYFRLIEPQLNFALAVQKQHRQYIDEKPWPCPINFIVDTQMWISFTFRVPWNGLHFFLKHLYWSIIALQWCVSFCFKTKWISYTYTYVPISLPSCISLPPTLPMPPL